jgi:hypothetical protein
MTPLLPPNTIGLSLCFGFARKPSGLSVASTVVRQLALMPPRKSMPAAPCVSQNNNERVSEDASGDYVLHFRVSSEPATYSDQ